MEHPDSSPPPATHSTESGGTGCRAICSVNGAHVFDCPNRTVMTSTGIDRIVADLPAHTEGVNREGTAHWKPCCRDTYSLAIEEAQAAIRAEIVQPPYPFSATERKVTREAAIIAVHALEAALADPTVEQYVDAVLSVAAGGTSCTLPEKRGEVR